MPVTLTQNIPIAASAVPKFLVLQPSATLVGDALCSAYSVVLRARPGSSLGQALRPQGEKESRAVQFSKNSRHGKDEIEVTRGGEPADN